MIERLAGIRRKRQEEDTEYEPERLPIRRCIPDYHMGLYEEEILEREEGRMDEPSGGSSVKDDKGDYSRQYFYIF